MEETNILKKFNDIKSFKRKKYDEENLTEIEISFIVQRIQNGIYNEDDIKVIENLIKYNYYSTREIKEIIYFFTITPKEVINLINKESVLL